MNYKKWQKRARHYAGGGMPAPYLEFLSKLVEEVGEVGKAINEEGITDVLTELEHVEFIAKEFRQAIRSHTGMELED